MSMQKEWQIAGRGKKSVRFPSKVMFAMNKSVFLKVRDPGEMMMAVAVEIAEAATITIIDTDEAIAVIGIMVGADLRRSIP